MSSLPSKTLVFIAVMSALGNVLSALSITISPIIPSIPLGPISVSLALDLSHVTTFIAALFGGPIIGGLTGMIGGMVAAYRFGFSNGNLVTGFGLPIGKALTGVAAGYIMRRVRVFERQKAALVLSTILSYIPEGVFTIFVFIMVFPVFFPTTPLSFLIPFTIQIIVKAFFEMIVMGLILAAMIENQGFTGYVKGFFAKPESHF
jgi:hypothetical protein